MAIQVHIAVLPSPELPYLCESTIVVFPENAGINIIPSLLYRMLGVVIGVRGCYRAVT